MKSVAILGMHADTVKPHLAEIGGYDEIWGLAHDHLARQIAHRLFESHSFEVVSKHCPAHIDVLRDIASDRSLYTPWCWPEPLGPEHVEASHATVGFVPQMESSVAFPMALAIVKADRIGLYGVNMDAADEYAYQRANMHYLIGYARAKGIEVYVPPESALFKSQWKGGYYGSPADVDSIAYRLE